MGRWPKEVTPIVLLEWRFYLMPSSLAAFFFYSRKGFFRSYISHIGGQLGWWALKMVDSFVKILTI